MPDFDASRFEPPAPVASVELRAQGRGLSNVSMLIDSGADTTFLPASCLGQLGLEADPQRRYEVIAYDGTQRIANSVYCDLVFLGRVYRGVYLVVEAAYGILGRDVLNHVALVLDGPRLAWREEHASD